jgi:hypothetical protein
MLNALLMLPFDINKPAPAAPPQVGDEIQSILSWALWIMGFIAILALLFVAGKMMMNHREGRGVMEGTGLLSVIAGILLVVMAFPLVNGLLF